MKKIIRNPHSYFKTTRDSTSVLQEPPAGFQAPTIVFENDCSVSVTYGDNPAFKINTKIEDVSNVIKVTTNTTRLADNLTTTKVLHIKDNDYYLSNSPYIDYSNPLSYHTKLEYETYHIRHNIDDSREYYNIREANELFLNKKDMADAIVSATVTEFMLILASMGADWKTLTDLNKIAQPLIFDFGIDGSRELQYLQYDNECIAQWKKLQSYFNTELDETVFITTYSKINHLQPTGPRLKIRFRATRGLKGDRGLDAWEIRHQGGVRNNPNLVNLRLCAKPSQG